jgi:PAS domain S-box-containing protein
MVSNANDSKRTQESVRIGQGHYETLVNSIDGIVYEVDAQTFKVEYVSKQAATMLGYSVAQWLGEPEFWENHIHPDDRANTVEQCKQAVVGKTSSQFEYRMIAADGRVVWLRDSLTVTEDDQTIKLRGLMVDITSSRRAETEREVLSQIIQGVTTTSNVDELLQLIHQSLKKVLYAENCIVSLYDKKTGLFQKRFCVDTFDTSSSPQKMLKSCSAYVFRTGQPLLMTQIMLNEMLERGDVELIGERAPSWLGVPLTTPTECIGVLVVQHYEEEDIYSERDVTFLSSVGGQVALAIERKRREDELKQRERQLGEAQRMARLGSWVWNITTNQVMWSAELYRICGVDPEEFGATYDAFLNLVHPDDRDMLKEVIHQTLQNHQAADYEFRFIPPHGRELVMQGHGEVILNTDGLPVRMIGTAQDITDKRRSEQSLRESEGRFRELFDDAPVGYHELDFEGRITCVNKTELSMLGYNVDTIAGIS